MKVTKHYAPVVLFSCVLYNETFFVCLELAVANHLSTLPLFDAILGPLSFDKILPIELLNHLYSGVTFVTSVTVYVYRRQF